jgi:N-acetylmuramoyl-L-alanine amidase
MEGGAPVREIKRVVVHHSASPFGDAALIDEWHRERGFDCIGYHYVILNGRRGGDLHFRNEDDGEVETGRPVEVIGAHAGRVGANSDSIGVCLIGNGRFTRYQFCALLWLLGELNAAYHFGCDGVVGHAEIDSLKPECPGFDMELLRAALTVMKEPGQ